MFSPKLLKFAITGAISVILLVTAVLGANHLGRTGVDTEIGNQDTDPAAIDDLTIIDVQQWCSVCDKRLHPIAPEEYKQWVGKTRAQLEESLGQYPGATVIAFAKEQVVIQLPPVRCAECAQIQWPPQGYIGLTEDNMIAIFWEDGSLYEVYGEAPGATIDILAEGIPFTSPEECQQWLINLTS